MPHELYPQILSKFGTAMCQLDEEQLEEQNLMGNDKMEPVGKN